MTADGWGATHPTLLAMSICSASRSMAAQSAEAALRCTVEDHYRKTAAVRTIPPFDPLTVNQRWASTPTGAASY
ncbi:hypothetical protein DYI23_02025 [Roseibium polysiphoniae]|uniref:Uncharacterized protein n=1 Tax=Roseibium polysiphoniae TaxID=2571221 RepID=A0A944GRA5_9HYPH|nr:hypothetical protein [Roseibium polysiphoniae]